MPKRTTFEDEAGIEAGTCTDQKTLTDLVRAHRTGITDLVRLALPGRLNLELSLLSFDLT